jgi:hypothetical protein
MIHKGEEVEELIYGQLIACFCHLKKRLLYDLVLLRLYSCVTLSSVKTQWCSSLILAIVKVCSKRLKDLKGKLKLYCARGSSH